MSMATPDELRQMARDVSALEGQYTRGLLKQGLGSLFNADTLLKLSSPLLSLFTDVQDDTTRRVAQGMEKVRQDMAKWRDEWKDWAEAGQKPTGTPYGVPEWQAVGRSIAGDIQFYTGEVVGRTAFVAAGQAVTDAPSSLAQSARTVAEAVSEAATSAGVRKVQRVAVVAGGALLLTVLLAAGGYAVRSVR